MRGQPHQAVVADQSHADLGDVQHPAAAFDDALNTGVVSATEAPQS
jgi:hypothetical protein